MSRTLPKYSLLSTSKSFSTGLQCTGKGCHGICCCDNSHCAVAVAGGGGACGWQSI
jgi:hypothetical protein